MNIGRLRNTVGNNGKEGPPTPTVPVLYLNPGGELLVQLLLVPRTELGQEGGGSLTLTLFTNNKKSIH